MTKPTISNNISLGNLIQIGALLVAGAAAWYGLKATSDTAAVAASENALAIEDLRDRVIPRVADRVQSLETSYAVNGEQIRVLRRDIEEIKNGQREMNGLLREILNRGTNVLPR